MEINNTLNYDKIEQTIGRLSLRINERFPGSGLGKTALDFHQFTEKSKATINILDQPNYFIRSLVWLSIVIVLGIIIYTLTLIDFKLEGTLSEIVTVMEALLNDIVLVGAGIFFLYTFENRWKRTRVIKFLNEVKGFAHVVDMHQLTKDPQLVFSPGEQTENSPKREMSKYELQRYLDYCSEFLSLIGKVAALYSQKVPDEVIANSSSEIETLCSNIANKVWQKLAILNQRG